MWGCQKGVFQYHSTRRWYDGIMPFQPPWDNRPTVGEVANGLVRSRVRCSDFAVKVREQLEAQTNNAAGSLALREGNTERHAVIM